MKQSINSYEFKRQFEELRPNNFTAKGLDALFDYFTEYEDSTDVEVELDVIAICCDFTEYEDLEEIKGSYTDIESIEDLEDNTTVIQFDGGIIIQNY